MKTLIIGIDGATFNIILPMVNSGKLPNLSRLIKKGVYGNLKSTYPPITFPAWTSMKTGKNPAKHGVFDFLKGIPYISEENVGVLQGDKKDKSFWRILSENGYRVGVINVPATYPPEKINGAFISGFGTPSLQSNFTYPKSLKNELIKKCDFEFDIVENRINGKEKQFIKKIIRSTKTITKSVLYILDKFDFDFLMLNYMAVDQTQHFFYGYRDKNHPLYDEKKSEYGKVIDDIYSLIDEQIGIILSKINKDVNVIVVSDHGFGPFLKKIYLNEWLEKEGFLVKKENSNKKTFSKIPKKIVGKIAHKIGPGFAKYLPKSLKNRANDYILWTNEINWDKTKAYSGGYPGKIFINLKGRELNGIIKPGEEYEKLRSQLIKKLKSFRDPETNEKIVDIVLKKEEIYNGRYLEFAPDLIAVMKNMSYLNVTGFSKGKIFYPPTQGGDHRLNGIFIAHGPDIKDKGIKLEKLAIYDIAPTILHMFNLKLLNDYDGKVLKNIFKLKSKFSKKNIEFAPDINEEDLIKLNVRKLIKNKKI